MKKRETSYTKGKAQKKKEAERDGMDDWTYDREEYII